MSQFYRTLLAQVAAPVAAAWSDAIFDHAKRGQYVQTRDVRARFTAALTKIGLKYSERYVSDLNRAFFAEAQLDLPERDPLILREGKQVYRIL